MERVGDKLLRVFLSAVLAIGLLPGLAFAAGVDPGVVRSGSCGNCTWGLDDQGTLTVAPIDGTDGVFVCEYKPWCQAGLAMQVKKAVFKPGVKFGGGVNYEFDSCAFLFDGCENLTAVEGIETADFSEVTSLSSMFYGCSSLTSLNTSGWDVSSVTGTRGMFRGCSSLTALDVSGWDTSSATDMGFMFYGCSSLETLDVSGWDTSSVMIMDEMFGGCSSLESLDVSSWDTSLVFGSEDQVFKGMYSMFHGCSSLKSLDVSRWDVSSVRGTHWMFAGCSSLESLDVSRWDVSSAVDMYSMFAGCSSLASLDVSNWDVSSVTSMESVFRDCSSLTVLDVSNWDVSSATSFNGTFSGCSSLTALDVSGWDVSSATNVGSVFYGCSSLSSLDVSGWDTSSAKDMVNMFYGCSSLESLDLSGWDTSSVTTMDWMFFRCSSLVSLDLSGWDTSSATGDEGQVFTGVESMFDGCHSLDSLALGESFVLDEGMGLGHLSKAWRSVASGSMENPQGDIYLTTDELIADHNSSGKTETYVAVTKVDVPVANTGLVYTGAEQEGVGQGGGYTLSGVTSSEGAGEFEAVAKLDGRCVWADGTAEDKVIAWSIAPADIASASCSDIEAVPCIGKPYEPEIDLSYMGMALEKGTDYDVSYADNIEIGIASSIVTGKGNFVGTKTVEFEIVDPHEVADFVVSEDDGVQTYEFPLSSWSSVVWELSDDSVGAIAHASISSSSTSTGMTIKASIDFTPLNAGVTDLCAYVGGELKGKATIVVTASTRIDISDGEIRGLGDSYTYTGEQIVPEIEVWHGEATLEEGTDYIVSCENALNVGEATITVEGVGEYRGKLTSDFPIEPAVLTAIYAGESIYWDQEPALLVEVTGFVGGETSATASGYSSPAVTAPAALELGEHYELAPSGGTADNYIFEYKSGTLSVSGYPVEIPVAHDRDYNGNIQSPFEDALSLYVWGRNDQGQLGDGTIWSDKASPTKILEGVARVSLGYYRSAAITSDGSLYVWGDNQHGGVGDGTTAYRLVPTKVLDDVVQVALGGTHSAAVTSDGSLYVWGGNSDGQIGDGTTVDRLVPTKVLDGVAQISMGYYHSAAITSDGSLYTWGSNGCGLLGDGTTVDRLVPTKVMDGVAQISMGGDHSAAVTSDGSLYTWGGNYYGELGNGESAFPRTLPAKVLDDVAQISMGGDHSAAVTSDGLLYTWGCNDSGRLGDGTTVDRLVPTKVMDGVAQVSMGGDHSAAVTSDGSLYVWGDNQHGGVGDGTTMDRLVPTKVLDGVAQVSMGSGHSTALVPDPSSRHFSVSGDVSCMNAGSYTVEATPLEGYCWPDGSSEPKTIEWSIEPASILDVDGGQIAEQVYTGDPIEPELELSFNGMALFEGVDYEVTYSDNVAIGTATATVTGKGNFMGVEEISFDIAPSVNRLSGSYANQTSAAISSTAFDKSEWVIVARDDDFADAMSATGLAGALDAPIVLTNRNALSDAAADEIVRLGATKAYVIGGRGAIPADLESDLAGLGVTFVERVYGSYSWDTSVECAEKIVEHGGSSEDSIVAMSLNFQDALSISSFAYKYKVPIYLQTQSGDRPLPDAAVAMIERAGGTIYVPGGPGAVKASTVEGVFGAERVIRIYGEDGYDTSNQIAHYMVDNDLLFADVVTIACGAQAAKGTDALAGAALAGKARGVVLLANWNEDMEAAHLETIEGYDSQGSPAFLSAHADDILKTYILGGAYVMPEDLVEKVFDILS